MFESLFSAGRAVLFWYYSELQLIFFIIFVPFFRDKETKQTAILPLFKFTAFNILEKVYISVMVQVAALVVIPNMCLFFYWDADGLIEVALYNSCGHY